MNEYIVRLHFEKSPFNSRFVELTQGQRAIVDECDYQEVIQSGPWCAQWNRKIKSFYALRSVAVNNKKTTEQLHRFLLGLKHGDLSQGHHVNHDTLDNRRSNIHIVTHRVNNQSRLYHSKYGVCVYKMSFDRFRVIVCVNGSLQHVGYFTNLDEAHKARDDFIKDIAE